MEVAITVVIKGELNDKTISLLFESIGIVNYLCEVFLNFKSKYIEKLKCGNKEKTLEKVS